MAQNVRRVLISREKQPLDPFWVISGNFSMGQSNTKHADVPPIFLGGLFSRQPLLLSTLHGNIKRAGCALRVCQSLVA